MYKVKWIDALGKECAEMFDDLTLAMNHGKELGCFVTISGGGYDIVGLFGADTVNNGVLPDGTDYTWKKRRL